MLRVNKKYLGASADLRKKMNMLTKVHTQKDYERIRVEIEEARQRVLTESAEHRQFLEKQQTDAKIKVETRRKSIKHRVGKTK